MRTRAALSLIAAVSLLSAAAPAHAVLDDVVVSASGRIGPVEGRTLRIGRTVEKTVRAVEGRPGSTAKVIGGDGGVVGRSLTYTLRTGKRSTCYRTYEFTAKPGRTLQDFRSNCARLRTEHGTRVGMTSAQAIAHESAEPVNSPPPFGVDEHCAYIDAYGISIPSGARHLVVWLTSKSWFDPDPPPYRDVADIAVYGPKSVELAATCKGLPRSVARQAALAPITGTLDKPGYTVIAMGTNGAAAAVAAPTGSFSVVPPQPTVTLHLRAPDGTYAGPVLPRESRARLAAARAKVTRARRTVTARRRALATADRAVATARKALRRARSAATRRAAARRLSQARRRARKATARLKLANRRLRQARAARSGLEKLAATRAAWAVLGVRAGAPLGAIAVDTADGVALPAAFDAAAFEQWADTGVAAQATLGVPIGAGNFGLVASARRDGSAIGDRDLDGLPESLDVDDDGDLILDDSDPVTNTRATSGTFPGGSRLHVNTILQTHAEGSATVNGGSSDEQVAASQAQYGELNIFWMGFDDGTGELDCGQLAYCAAGGTGRLKVHPVLPWRESGDPFPSCCDADGDGLGSLTLSPGFPAQPPGAGAMTLFHGATVDQIGTGDVIIARGTADGTPVESATTVGFAFSTPPVLASYSDGQGNGAAFTYPRPASPPPSPVRAGPNGDVVLTFTLWRPQRERIATEPGTGRWIDMGQLRHMVTVFVPSTGPSNQTSVGCPASTLSETDPNLEPRTSTPYPGGYPDAGGFDDQATDQATRADNTLTYTVNVTQCLASKGFAVTSGQNGYLGFLAIATGDMGRIATAVSSLQFVVQ